MTVDDPAHHLPWLILRMELRRFFLDPRNLIFIPLSLLAVGASFSPQLPTPFIPVAAAVFAGLEPQFNNILYRSPKEFLAFNLFPVRWRPVVLVKNIATAIITLIVFCGVGIPTLYFSPNPVTGPDALGAMAYLSTVMFPLLLAGNRRSLQRPRPRAGLGADDLAEATIMLVVAGIASIPYMVLVAAPHSTLLSLVYAAALGVYWFRVSVRTTAVTIEKEHYRICQAS